MSFDTAMQFLRLWIWKMLLDRAMHFLRLWGSLADPEYHRQGREGHRLEVCTTVGTVHVGVLYVGERGGTRLTGSGAHAPLCRNGKCFRTML